MNSNPGPKPNYDFRTCLTKSEVIKPDVLQEWLTENPDQNPAEDATQLVKKKLLTEWQAKYLLSGRYRLHLGNYQLLKRVRRDSFGDRFIALHPQLGRTVQVQVLPVQLTDDPNQRETFLAKAGQAGELDHPNLAHVFDVDMQQGRYYLVTEYSPSLSLTELRSNSLDAQRVATIVRDSIAGLKHAHERSVVHDYLSMDNVLVNEEGVVKISQIALSPLAKKSTKMAKENVSPEQGDLLAIVRMGRRLLSEAPSNTATRQLNTLLSNLNTRNETNFNKSLTELDLWIEQSSVESPGHDSIKGSDADSKKLVVLPDGEVERLKKNAELTDRQKSVSKKPQRSRNETWNNGPGDNNLVQFVLLGAVTLLLGVIVYSGVHAIRKMAPERSTSQTQTAMQESGKSKNHHRSLLGSKSLALLDSTGDLKVVTDRAGEPSGNALNAQQSTPNLTLPPPVVNPDAFSPKPDVQSNRPSKPVKMADPATFNSTSTVQTGVAKVSGVDRGKQPTLAVMKSDPVLKEKTPANDLDRNAADTSAVPKVKQDNSQENADEKEGKAPGDLFAGFPASVDLPPTESTNEVTLATLKQSSIHLLGMELRSAEGIGKGRTSFDLERNETTKRQWTLLAKKSPRNNGDPVGQFDFDKTSGQINFHWLPKAASSRIANYVRNCALKMKLGGSYRAMALRSPVKLTDLKLSRKKPSATIEAEVEWLPDPELITVELLPFKQSGLPKTWIEPAIVPPGTPLKIHFHEAASNRFMWLQLDTSIRKNVTLDMNLMLKHADGTIQPIKRESDTKKLEVLLKEAAVKARQQYDRNKDIVAPKGQITKFKDYVAKLKSTAKKTLKQSQIAGENITILESFYDRALPMRVMFRTDDYQIVLLESAP